ncbi:MAG: hypothetical protein MJY66_05140 [Bacteroidaceae bacterium]|nr:hypothetical protein [Bacteroidaceae bacterium]
MDETFTSSSAISENLLRTALKSGSYGSPADRTLDFIRSFAASLRFIPELSEETSAFSLN